jgi:hypothetical protein
MSERVCFFCGRFLGDEPQFSFRHADDDDESPRWMFCRSCLGAADDDESRLHRARELLGAKIEGAKIPPGHA